MSNIFFFNWVFLLKLAFCFNGIFKSFKLQASLWTREILDNYVGFYNVSIEDTSQNTLLFNKKILQSTKKSLGTPPAQSKIPKA